MQQSQKVLWVVLVHCFSKKFQTMAREAMDMFASAKGKQEQCIDHIHITFQDCRMHSFSDNLSRNSCMGQHTRYI